MTEEEINLEVLRLAVAWSNNSLDSSDPRELKPDPRDMQAVFEHFRKLITPR